MTYHLVKSATPGIVLVATGIFFDKLEDISILEKTITFLKVGKYPYTALLNVASEILIDGFASTEAVIAFRAEVNTIKKAIETADTNPILLELLRASTSLANGNPKALESINKNLVFLGNTTLNELYSQLFPATNAKEAIRNYIRINGLTSLDTVIKYLELLGLEHTYPKGLPVLIDENGVLYTIAKKRIEGVPFKAEVKLNPNYDPIKDDSYIFQAKTENAKSFTYYYTTDYKVKGRENKFKAVKVLSTNIKSLRTDWTKIIMAKAPSREEAIVLEIIYQTQARIGSSSNATLDKRTGNYLRTYGITTILKKHVTVTDEGLYFEYPGKGAYKGDVIHYQKHNFVASDNVTKEIVKELSKRLKTLNDEDKVFQTNDTKVRALFQQLGAPEGVTVHKLRTLKGTMMMTEAIKNHPFKGKTTSAKVTKWLRQEALEVGIQLGHMSGEKYTAATAVAHYISPQVMVKLYKDLDVVIPKTMAKLAGII